MNTIFGLSKENESFLMITVGLIFILLDLLLLAPTTMTHWSEYTYVGQKAAIIFDSLCAATGLGLTLYGLTPSVGDESLDY